MKLLSVKIEGFRNIESTKINLHDFTFLVSTNSYGKSNLLEALKFAIDFIKASSLDKYRLMARIDCIPFNKHMDSQNFVADFVFSSEIDRSHYLVNYGFEFVWLKNNKKGREIKKEWLSIKENDKVQKYNKLIERDKKCLYKGSINGECDNVLKVGKNELMLNKLQINEALYYYKVIKELNSIRAYTEHQLDTSGLFTMNPLIIENHAEFDLTGIINIPRTLFHLKDKYRERYDILKDAFFKLFPNIIEIEVQEISLIDKRVIDTPKNIPYTIDNKVYYLYVQDINMNQPLSFENLSDGAKRILLMLTYTVLADLSGIALITFEEPENSIHPKLLQSYLSILKQLSSNCKIIMASHSPYILQYVNTKDIYVGKPNKKGIASFSKFNSGKISQLLKDASDSNVSIGGYIFELLSGGEDDIRILLDYLEN